MRIQQDNWNIHITVLTATFNSYGNRQISIPHKINTPEPIDTIDYIREGTSYTKFGKKSIHWGLLGKWVKYNKKYSYLFIYTFFLWSAYRSDPWMDFYAR